MTPAPAGLGAGGLAAWARLAGPIAHRGLWGPDAPENTLPALRRAAEAGYGVEFDVRLSADGVPMVFHDADLERLTGEAGPLSARKARELQEIRVGGLAPIPTLGDALCVAGGRALALVELKADGDPDAIAERALEVIGRDDRPLAVISFSASVHRAVAERRSDLLRGVHVTGDAAQAREAAAADAHFLLPSLDALEPRDELQVAWTARTAGQYAWSGGLADAVIFEGFRPEPRSWR